MPIYNEDLPPFGLKFLTEHISEKLKIDGYVLRRVRKEHP